MSIVFRDGVICMFDIIKPVCITDHQARRQTCCASQHHHGGRIIIAIATLEIEEKIIGHITASGRCPDIQCIWKFSQIILNGQGAIIGTWLGCGQVARECEDAFRHRIGQDEELSAHPIGIRGGRGA